MYSAHQAINQCRQVTQQLIQQTQQASNMYRQMLNKEQQNITMLEQMVQRERQAVQTIQQSLQGHDLAIQRCQEVIAMCNQLEQQLASQPLANQPFVPSISPAQTLFNPGQYQ